jgi:hypothetical protein
VSQPNELYAYFAIKGDFDPDEITRLTGVTPTRVRRKGEVGEYNRAGYPCDGWYLYSRLEKTRPLEEHISDVITQLAANRTQFIDLSLQHGGVMQLVAYFKEYYTGLHFDRQLTESLAEYSLDVDFDFYFPDWQRLKEEHGEH